MGGTFDPVHNGHLIVARSIAEQLQLPRITLVPSARPPHKKPAHATPAQRLEMLRLAVEGESLFDICDMEIDRDGPSYTLDTLIELRRIHGPDVKLTWIVGADMLEDLPCWHRIGEVLGMADIVIAARFPWVERLGPVLDSLEGRISPEALASMRKACVASPLIDISSTAIRRRIARGLSVRFMVPDSVLAYINRLGVYASAPG